MFNVSFFLIIGKGRQKCFYPIAASQKSSMPRNGRMIYYEKQLNNPLFLLFEVEF